MLSEKYTDSDYLYFIFVYYIGLLMEKLIFLLHYINIRI
jgi:hypothetical protein